ncbi:transmembrane protein 26-like [Acropora palmata]|uniref:transmembrane protein 26-like n=1 Tax=Acropora palmata TaxID=6131 RepID=UPI003DA11442
MAFFTFFSGIFTRVMFLAHGASSVYFVVEYTSNPKYWWICTGLVFLLAESFYTIVIRKGKEYKYFWPGSFFYIVTLLPAIWVAELKILDEKVQNGADTCESNARSYNHEVGNGLIVINIDSGQLAQKWSKLGLILLIIVGRWLLPRGELTRDQLSSLLLVYVANAADIMELFEVFDQNPILWCQKGVAIAVLSAYTWSFLQFSLVFTATADTVPDTKQLTKGEGVVAEEKKNSEAKLPKYIKKLIVQKAEKQKADLAQIEKSTDLRSAVDQLKQLKAYKSRGRQARFSIHDTALEVVQVQREVKREEEALEEHIKRKQKLKLHGDLYSILTLMIMQDGPFLIVRLVLIIAYDVKTTLHLFFTGKNAMALALLVYRLVVLVMESNEEEDEEEDEYFYALTNA